MNELDFLACRYRFKKLKCLQIFGWAWSKIILANEILEFLDIYISRATGSLSKISYMLK